MLHTIDDPELAVKKFRHDKKLAIVAAIAVLLGSAVAGLTFAEISTRDVVIAPYR